MKRWGEGASMIRKEWKPRNGDGKETLDTMRYRDEDDKMDEDEDDEGEDDDDEESEEEVAREDGGDEDDLEATPRMLPRTTGIHSPQSSISSSQSQRQKHSKNLRDDTGVAGLTDTLNSLSLVPNSVRFGRGGNAGGFIPNVHGGRGRGRGRGRGGLIVNPTGLGPVMPHQPHAMDVDGAHTGPNTRKGGRGRKIGIEIETPQDGPQTGSDPARGRGGGRGRARARGRGRGGRGS